MSITDLIQFENYQINSDLFLILIVLVTTYVFCKYINQDDFKTVTSIASVLIIILYFIGIASIILMLISIFILAINIFILVEKFNGGSIQNEIN